MAKVLPLCDAAAPLHRELQESGRHHARRRCGSRNALRGGRLGLGASEGRTAGSRDSAPARGSMAFRRFSQSMDMLLPDPRALEYGGDLGWLGKIRQAAKARYRDDSLDISDCGDKVRRLIEEAVIADGVQVLVKEVSLFSGEFDEKLKALQSSEAMASEMEHAIRHEMTSSSKRTRPTSRACANASNGSSPTARRGGSAKPSSSRCSRV
jgi:hypothetical protein